MARFIVKDLGKFSSLSQNFQPHYVVVDTLGGKEKVVSHKFMELNEAEEWADYLFYKSAYPYI